MINDCCLANIALIKSATQVFFTHVQCVKEILASIQRCYLLVNKLAYWEVCFLKSPSRKVRAKSLLFTSKDLGNGRSTP